ncbi:MAG TPA: hypothetical protein VIE44_03150 [Methylomirabilota bacterium]
MICRRSYQDHGLAASRVGRSRQWIEDLTTGPEPAATLPAEQRSDILLESSLALREAYGRKGQKLKAGP